MNYELPADPSEVAWKVEAQGRAWSQDEARPRYDLSPDKIELIRGKVLWSDEDRLRMLGLLLENCGAGAAVRFGDPEVWRRAVATLDDPETSFRHALEAANRRRDSADEYDPTGLLHFYEQMTMPEFAEHAAAASDPTPPTTREQVLDRLRQNVERYQRRERGDETCTEFHTNAVNVSGDQAAVLLTCTQHHRRRNKAAEGSERRETQTTQVERWRETWTRTDTNWRLQRRDRIEGPWTATNAEPHG